MSFVALESVRVATDQSPLFDGFRLQRLKELTLDELGLRFSLQADHAHRAIGIAWVIDAGDNLRHYSIGFGFVDRVLSAASTIAVVLYGGQQAALDD
jgi:hypothetical protein